MSLFSVLWLMTPRVDRSAAPMTTAAASPPRRPVLIAQASTGPATAMPGSDRVDGIGPMPIIGTLTSRQQPMITRSATSSGHRRSDGRR